MIEDVFLSKQMITISRVKWGVLGDVDCVD